MANSSGSRPGSTGSQLSSRDRVVSGASGGGTPVSCQPVTGGTAAESATGVRPVTNKYPKQRTDLGHMTLRCTDAAVRADRQQERTDLR